MSLNLTILENLKESLSQITPMDAFNFLFHNNYYPFFYAIECLFVCLYLRISPLVGSEIGPIHSLVLGFCYSYLPRAIFGYCLDRRLPEIYDYSALYIYGITWALLNINPFDWFFKVLNSPILLTLISLANSFGNYQLLCHYIYNVLDATMYNQTVTFAFIFVVYSVYLAIDYFDIALFGKSRKYSLYPVQYLLRMWALSYLIVSFSQPSIIPVEYRISFYNTIPFASLFGLISKAIDLISTGLNPFQFGHIIPRFLRPTFHKDNSKCD